MPYRIPPSSPTWTITSLIGSYLDLTLAYLFLVGSTLFFLASKLLSFFSLPFPSPSPSSGLFGDPNRIHTLLLDSTRTRIESIHSSIRYRFPFNVIFNDPSSSVGFGPGPAEDHVLRLAGPEAAKDANWAVAPVKVRRIRRRKGKGIRVSWQKEGFGDNFEAESVREESSVAQILVEDGISMIGEAATATATEFCSVEDTFSANNDHASNDNVELTIKNLERELEEAQVAHAALYLELEKERSAAASAADEAMAMILRLQSEKAAVEMESRQYQRMIEEKSAYDEEEMEILKEIIVRREREKHVLEKEVEAYRQMMLSGEIGGNKPDYFFDKADDTSLMLKTIYESIGKKETVSNKIKWTEDGARILYPELPDAGEEWSVEFQEKGMLMAEASPSEHFQSSNFRDDDAIRYGLDEPQHLEFGKQASFLSEEGVVRGTQIDTRLPVNELDREDQYGDQRGSESSQFETESSVLDVHVIEDKHDLDYDENERASGDLNVLCVSERSEKGGRADDSPETSADDLLTNTSITNWVRGEQAIQRSCSDMTKGSKLIDTESDATSHFDQRTSSMSAVDSERFKLETEVEILRKRLKTIQQGRENLSFCVEYREKETCQLQLLEEIASQLQEIRKITEPGRDTRQASLPPLSSKVNSKKRRCRSVSWGLHESA